MDVDGARDDGVGKLRVHRRQQGVHDLVTTDPQYGGEDLFGIRVHQNLDETIRLAALAGVTDAGHHALADQHPSTGFARLLFGDADATERRIGEQTVTEDPVRNTSWVVVEQVGSDDLVVVVRRVGEGALAVAVAQCPDAGNVGAQFIIDPHVAPLIDIAAGLLQSQIVRVRHAQSPTVRGSRRLREHRCRIQRRRRSHRRFWRSEHTRR